MLNFISTQMSKRLSILIATTPSRSAKLAELMAILQPQLTDDVELIMDDSVDYNIGIKRNFLLSLATASHIVFIDDDDLISPNYVSKILPIIEHVNPDCIGINGIITTNGGNERRWWISKDFPGWYQTEAGYFRTPNHISPVRRELALLAGFPETSFGEDAEYSRRLHPLLGIEVKIEEPLYHYRYVKDK
jgi:glycosyltransferase involved in cell wall biosynthesis